MNSGVTLSFVQLLLLGAVPAIITGIVGLAAGFLGPWWLQRRKEAAEKKQKRAEKFEELVAALYEHRHWLDEREDIRAFGAEGKLGVSPLGKVLAICDAHFPEIRASINRVRNTATDYELVMSKAGRRRLDNDEKFAEDIPAAFTVYARSLHDVTEELRNFAKKELQ
jgi:hypothetical protein